MFISFEGGDGAGKTTLLRYIAAKLEEHGVNYLLTREPGGSVIAEKIRHVILSMDNVGMDSRTEALLYAAARRQHVVDRVRPALAVGRVVLCDRYVDSSYAYQGIGRNLGVEAVQGLNDWATEGLMPVRTYYLDLEPEEGQRRILAGRQDEINRLDAEDLAFHRKLREGYLDFAAADPERYRVIAANQSPSDVYAAVWQDLRVLLNLN